MPIYAIKALNESALAKYQQAQLGNNCAYHAVSAAINVLAGTNIDGLIYADQINAMPFPTSLKYRLYDNGPTLPVQQVNLAKLIATDHGISINAQKANPQNEDLLLYLMEGNVAVLVTIGWYAHHPPEITYGLSSLNMNASKEWAGFHTMLLARYDPTHVSQDGLLRPWGLINSWTAGGDQLFWMQDVEFKRSWNTYTPLSGSRASVLITLK